LIQRFQHNYGFRPAAVRIKAISGGLKRMCSPGRRVGCGRGLEKFFDRVSHDILIDRLRNVLPMPE